MSISELFDELIHNIPKDLIGQLILDGNCIIWTYDIDRDGMPEEEIKPDEDDEFEFDFTSIKSSEELLQQGYDDDLLAIQNFIVELDDYADWTFSDPEIGETVISFKIF
jgi:hypothetical protein